jgi:hypothetical protein
MDEREAKLMAAIETEIMTILTSFYILGIWSQAYKDNPIYNICLSALIGTTIGHQVLTALTSSWRVIGAEFVAGDLVLLVPIVWGLLQYTFFSATYISIYRSAAMLYFAVKLGGIMSANISKILSVVTGWTNALVASAAAPTLYETTGLIINLITGIVTLLYFTYWDRIEGAAPPAFWRGLRTLGLLIYSCYFGYVVGFFYVGRSLQLGAVEATARMMETSGVYVVIIVAVAILIDATIGFRRILGLQPKQVVTAES